MVIGSSRHRRQRPRGAQGSSLLLNDSLTLSGRYTESTQGSVAEMADRGPRAPRKPLHSNVLQRTTARCCQRGPRHPRHHPGEFHGTLTLQRQAWSQGSARTACTATAITKAGGNVALLEISDKSLYHRDC